jgi:hypothetical protein
MLFGYIHNMKEANNIYIVGGWKRDQLTPVVILKKDNCAFGAWMNKKQEIVCVRYNRGVGKIFFNKNLRKSESRAFFSSKASKEYQLELLQNRIEKKKKGLNRVLIAAK